MSDTSRDTKADPERDPAGNPFDRADGHSGQEYNKDREAALGAQRPGGTVAARPGDPAPPHDPAIPPDNGRRASFDPQTGEVHGSGSGAGGGNPGEDFDSDAATGDGYPVTGSEGRPKGGDGDLGPGHVSE